MHILVTADTLGGVWTYTRELVTGLVRRGARVTLVSFGDIPTGAKAQWLEPLPEVDYRPTAFKLEWMQDSAADLKDSAAYLCSLIEDTKPDLLHLSQFYYGALECDVPRVVVAHSDVLSWWTSVHGHPAPDSDWISWYRAAVERGLERATAVVAPTQWMLDQVTVHYGRPRLGSVVYNGRDPSLFNPELSKQEKIVSIGRLWDAGKNAALLLREVMPAPLYIVGPNRHPELSGAAFPDQECGGLIHLVPEQGEYQLSQLFASATIYAATSQYEPFGLAPVEAAFSGCAIVASDVPPFRELWDGAALFFRNNDSASLRSALEQLTRAPELRQDYARLAYDRACQRFTADRMVDDYMGLYQQLVPAEVMAR